MSNTWFRYHIDSLHDPKVQTLPPEVFKIWVNSLCIACNGNGALGNVSSVSFVIRETVESVSSAFHTLKEVGLIVTDGETFHVKNWNKRQYKSDTSTERVKRFRKQSGNATETPPDTDTDTDTESKKIPNGISPLRSKKTEAPPGFDEFWKAYPPHNGTKKSAIKAYISATKETNHDEIIRGVKAYHEWVAKTGTERKFTKHPSTWLNAGGWTADYAADRRRSNPSRATAPTIAERKAAALAAFEAEQGALPTG